MVSLPSCLPTNISVPPMSLPSTTLASHLCGRGSIPVMAVSGKAGSCLPLVGSLQYRTLANYMYWFPLPFQLPVVIWPVQCWKRRKTPNKINMARCFWRMSNSLLWFIWLVFTLLVRDLSNNIVKRFSNIPPFDFYSNTQECYSWGVGGLPPFKTVNLVSYFLDNFL